MSGGPARHPDSASPPVVTSQRGRLTGQVRNSGSSNPRGRLAWPSRKTRRSLTPLIVPAESGIPKRARRSGEPGRRRRTCSKTRKSANLAKLRVATLNCASLRSQLRKPFRVLRGARVESSSAANDCPLRQARFGQETQELLVERVSKSPLLSERDYAFAEARFSFGKKAIVFQREAVSSKLHGQQGE